MGFNFADSLNQIPRIEAYIAEKEHKNNQKHRPD